mgnify:CR=1 FL=1
MKNMAILVLGGAGYIGSHTVYELIDAGRDVVVADNLLTGFRAAVHPKARFYELDIRDRKALDQLFEQEKIEGVIHFAASSQVGESMSDPLKYYDNNLGGTICLLESMVAHGVDKIVFSSTAATFGEPEYVPIDEAHPQNPTNPYGESKLIVEKMLKWCDLAHGLKFCALRYFNVAGAWHDGSIGEDHRPESHLIPLILQVAQGKREQLSLFGTDYPTKDGTCIRDYIHVEDLIDAHFLALDYLKRTNTSAAFNLGNGQGFSNREIIEAARRVTGHPIPVREEGRRPGDPATLIASSRKATEVLGWQPKYTNVEDIIASAWKWHSSHPDGYGG